MADFCAEIAQKVDLGEWRIGGLWQCEAFRASQRRHNIDVNLNKFTSFRKAIPDVVHNIDELKSHHVQIITCQMKYESI